MKNNTLIIGEGEVGMALATVLGNVHDNVFIKDISDLFLENVKWLHICYPYSKKFVEITKNYIKEYKPVYTIIHSTVPIGTTSAIGKNVWHSPIRGVHPNIADGILTFVKYLGGKYNKEVIKYFEKAKIKIKHVAKSETTELGKILDTTYYGWNIVFCKEVKKICDKYKADFNIVYTEMNTTYNEGYRKLNKANVVRPVFIPILGKIGGHCVINNCKLLDEDITKTLLEYNEGY